MTGRILIIDSVPTNRIVLKVKMLAAQFAVDSCGTQVDAMAIISENQPDLILINLSDASEDRHAFCKSLKSQADTAGIAIISVGVADTASARFAALDAGADDVLPRPINDSLLLARIRSLLRVRNAHHELMLRDGTGRALGFEESRSGFASFGHVAVLSKGGFRASDIEDLMSDCSAIRVSHRKIDAALGDDDTASPDVFVLDGSEAIDNTRILFQTIADLRSRATSRLASIMIIVPENQPETAALVLDLGADDAVSRTVSKGEMALRIAALIKQKRRNDRLRLTVRDGLHAAVTDPLTGLYNRRYLVPHLARMAEQSRQFQREFAVMMIDIDHFKSINDTYGHTVGDQVLIGVANRLRDNLRAIDILARVGGEEFLIAMPGTTTLQAELAADRLRQIISREAFAVGAGLDPVHVTVSFGVVLSGLQPLDQTGLDGMWKRADAALYRAKELGRDIVEMDDRTAA